jgi:ParB family chromosome partitioning protein
MSVDKPRRLGRGLEALIPGAVTPTSPTQAGPPSDYQRLPLERIKPNPYQPRREFDEAELAELQASLKASGLLQPITVRRSGDGFELISGERRYRAAARLGWSDIPAIVRDVDDRTLLTLALVENLQRADLNAVEEARGYRRLSDEFGFTHAQIAEAVGKDRTSITAMLRILQLPPTVLSLVEKGQLSAGHARALVSLEDERKALTLANEAIARQLSVRELERRVRDIMQPPEPKKPEPTRRVPAAGGNAVIKRMEDELRRRLQTDAKIRLTGPERGTVEIAFYSADDLERLLDVVLGPQRERE